MQNNQLTQWGSTAMTYDANGDTLSDGMNTSVWNALNRSVSADNNGAVANAQLWSNTCHASYEPELLCVLNWTSHFSCIIDSSLTGVACESS
jgi:hypothetical protein